MATNSKTKSLKNCIKSDSSLTTRFEVPLSLICFAVSLVRNDIAIDYIMLDIFRGPWGAHSKYRLEESLGEKIKLSYRVNTH